MIACVSSIAMLVRTDMTSYNIHPLHTIHSAGNTNSPCTMHSCSNISVRPAMEGHIVIIGCLLHHCTRCVGNQRQKMVRNPRKRNI